MSNVRLSNGSPTLERMDARLSEHPKPSACRNLFGPVDHEELKRELKGHLREMEDASLARWNFDFKSHTPLPGGRYEWEAVDRSRVPPLYRAAPGPAGSDGRGAEEPQSPAGGRKRKGPACRDSSPSKRSHAGADDVSCCQSLTRAGEHTPRKSSPRPQT
ncbi:cyclin dependent kinase inhibitor 1Bb [Denticeps clupeoides]|uniref:cyclin dependent kinase inhibitor 1Bb n=1 Tax=Denticeps clupeoides TaxID=299321 RepID=UPI0010A44E6A|nr:cyclin-dependent kinase inhibitor 1B-like [Denticeps clupeoides]